MQPRCILSLQILPDIHSQFFFQIDQPFRNVLGALVCRFILIQILIQRLHAHIAAVSHEVCDGPIRLIHRQLHVGLDHGHALSHGIGFLSRVMVSVQLRADLPLQLFMLSLAVGQASFQPVCAHIAEHIVNRGNAHLDSRIAFPQQTHRILLDHQNSPFNG